MRAMKAIKFPIAITNIIVVLQPRINDTIVTIYLNNRIISMIIV